MSRLRIRHGLKNNVVMLGRGALPWYRAGGAPAPIAVWLAKGAASLAASYVNLVSPGTYNAAPGTAPELHANGWTANSSAFLKTGLVPAGTDWTIISRHISISNSTHGFFGVYHGATQCLLVRHIADNVNYYNGGSVYDNAGSFLSGVVAISGKNVYRNGVDTGNISAGGTNPTAEIFLMCYNNGSGTATAKMQNGYLAGCAVWNSTLTPAQVLAVSTAMAAL